MVQRNIWTGRNAGSAGLREMSRIAASLTAVRSPQSPGAGCGSVESGWITVGAR